jgi:hypothetical protein
MATTVDLIEDVTDEGYRVQRESKSCGLLEQYYSIYNRQCFGGTLPFLPVFWAKSITLVDGQPANAIYVFLREEFLYRC